jgi:hypothetical protein
MITLRFSTIDGCRSTKRYKTIEGARKAVAYRLGSFELGGTYAISGDGIVKVEADGCKLSDLREPDAYREPTDEEIDEFEREEARREAAAEAAYWASQAVSYRPYRTPGCKCSDQQLTLVGCECGDLPF